MTDHHHFVLVDFGEAGQDGAIIAKMFIAVQFDELVEGQVQIVAGVGTVLVTRDLIRSARESSWSRFPR
jgi:hypothetical protein